MPLLAMFFGGLLTSLVNFLAEFITKRLAVIVVIVAAMAAGATAFAAVIDNALTQISMSAPAGYIQTGLSLLPSNTDNCIAILISVKIAEWAHSWYIKVLTIKAM